MLYRLRTVGLISLFLFYDRIIVQITYLQKKKIENLRITDMLPCLHNIIIN